jgi:sorbitol-specific phosphotransferase system component IIBC
MNIATTTRFDFFRIAFGSRAVCDLIRAGLTATEAKKVLTAGLVPAAFEVGRKCGLSYLRSRGADCKWVKAEGCRAHHIEEKHYDLLARVGHVMGWEGQDARNAYAGFLAGFESAY